MVSETAGGDELTSVLRLALHWRPQFLFCVSGSQCLGSRPHQPRSNRKGSVGGPAGQRRTIRRNRGRGNGSSGFTARGKRASLEDRFLPFASEARALAHGLQGDGGQ